MEQLEGQYSIEDWYPCKNCFHEDQGKCWASRSKYFEQPIPMDICTYYDGCVLGEVEE